MNISASEPHSQGRRRFLLAGASIPFAAALAACTSWAAKEPDASSAEAQLARLEKTLDGRLGIFALNTADGSQLGHRAREHFPVSSTFKVLLASAILKRSEQAPKLMWQSIRYAQGDLVPHSPITQRHVKDGMTVSALCAAALQYSDNTAANLLMRMLGGPAAVTAFARSIGDDEFRLDRWEIDLNTAMPGDPRDTSTPEAMGRSLQRLVLGNALPPHLRGQLQEWLRGNTTGAARIRDGVPPHWEVGDKTGGGAYGTANDIAVLWPPHRAPVVVAIYTTRHQQDAKAREDVVASTARIIVNWLGESPHLDMR